jgi:outer membrane receptor protein involved in Fe transport
MANFKLNYTIQKDLEAFIRIDNLLNSSVYVWNRFRERGTFFALGARYLF